MGGGGGGWGGPQIFSCYYVYKQLPQKNVLNLGKQERSFQVISSVTHTKTKAQKCPNI